MANRFHFSVRQSNSGFALVELSIVLVIVGVLIGGLLIGQAIVSSAKNHSVIKEIASYEIMIDQYEMKFKYLPGDDPNAFNKFGSACGANALSTVYGTGGCNGDADRNWEGVTCCQQSEREKAWHHLYLSGINKKSLPYWGANMGGGTFSAGKPTWIPGQNMTASSWSKMAGYRFDSQYISLAEYSVAAIWSYASIAPNDARAIDAKMDDGLPQAGTVLSYAGYGIAASNCYSSNQYVNSGAKACVMYFQVIGN